MRRHPTRRFCAALVLMLFGLAPRQPAVAQAAAGRLADPAASLDVRGTVHGVRGEPLGGAELLLTGDSAPQPLRARSDGNGNFRIPVERPGVYHLEVAHEGYETSELAVEILAGSASTPGLEIVLAREGHRATRFEVATPDGQPAAGARVLARCWRPLVYAQCETDPDGGCRVETDRLADHLLVWATAPGFSAHVRLDAEALEASTVTLALEKEPWELVPVEGRVTRASGEPLAGASVTLGDPKLHQPILHSTETDDDGRFFFAGVAEGVYFISASAEGLAPATARLKAVEAAPPVHLKLARGTTITGRVLDLAPEQALAPYVTANEVDSVDEGFVWRMRGYPRGHAAGPLANGEYRIENVPPGLFNVFVWIDEARYEGFVRIREGQESASVDLVRSIDRKAAKQRWLTSPVETERFRGRVVDAMTDEPLPGVTIARIRTDLNTTSAVDGSFEFAPMARWGPREFLFTLPGYVDHHLELSELPEEGPTIRMQRGATLELVLRWSDGHPLDWARVTLLDEMGESVAEAHTSDLPIWRDLPAGEFTLRVESGYGAKELSVRIPGRLSVEFPPLGEVQVRVLDLELDYGDGWLEGVSVVMRPLDHGEPVPPVEVDGSLSVKGLAPGLWSVEVRSGDGRSWHDTVEVKSRRLSTVLLR